MLISVPTYQTSYQSTNNGPTSTQSHLPLQGRAIHAVRPGQGRGAVPLQQLQELYGLGLRPQLPLHESQGRVPEGRGPGEVVQGRQYEVGQSAGEILLRAMCKSAVWSVRVDVDGIRLGEVL